MIYEWHCIFTPVEWRAAGVGCTERGKARSGCSRGVRSEQLKESRDDGRRSEAGAEIRGQN